ncbi:hypothetical protein Bca4012_019925 [Brassica carinata]
MCTWTRFIENPSPRQSKPEQLLNIIIKGSTKRSFNSTKKNSKKQRGSTSEGSTRTVLKDITNTAHLPKTNSRIPSSTFNESTKDIYEDEDMVGTDLFGGIIDGDEVQVFDCSSQEDTDTENDETDVDDPMDSELDPVINIEPLSAHMGQRPGVFLSSAEVTMNKFSPRDGEE